MQPQGRARHWGNDTWRTSGAPPRGEQQSSLSPRNVTSDSPSFCHSPNASCSSRPPVLPPRSSFYFQTLFLPCALVSFLLGLQLTVTSSAKLSLLPQAGSSLPQSPVVLTCPFNPLQGNSHSKEGLCSFMYGGHPLPGPSTEEVLRNCV